MFDTSSQAIIYGKHLDVGQRMLDFDFLAGRWPSVGGFIDPGARRTGQAKLFFWDQEVLIPLYPTFEHIPTNAHINTFLNFASFRSAAEATRKALESKRFQTIVIIAEGIPERDIREIIAYNEQHDRIRIIGPATAGAIAAGVLRMGNAGGSLDSIVSSRLYQKGSVGFVSRSGGMSNEMYRVIAGRTDGIHTGIALGGDRFVGSTFSDVVLEYEANPEIEMIVLLGEVGSRDELVIADLIAAKKITKPVVAYVSGSFAESLTTEVQFGHAGAKANAQEEKASYKNNALRKAGATVPESYQTLWDCIEQVFATTARGKTYHISHDIPRDIQEKLTKIAARTPTKFISTISDERGEELLYNHIPLRQFLELGSIASVIGHLWLKRDLPSYALEFLNAVIILLADHGPAVSGAANTIVTARAGKDILSSLVSGLMTIGPRFWGAIDGAARCFYEAVKNQESPEDFVARMKRSGVPIPWIGHKVKSKFNPDARCEWLRNQAKQVPVHNHLLFAQAVESLTLEKKSNLILNVDGHIAAILLDIFHAIGMSDEEIETYIDAGLFNAIFILARSIGFIGHALDQKRLGQPLYRIPWEDIYYGE